MSNAIVGLRSRIDKNAVIQVTRRTSAHWPCWRVTGISLLQLPARNTVTFSPTCQEILEVMSKHMTVACSQPASISLQKAAAWIDISLNAVQDAMIIGADYYESEDQRAALLAAGRIPIGIGQGSVISNTIVDKNARIGQNCTIVNKDGVEEAVREDEGLYIRSGIVCVLRNAEIPNGTQV